MTSFSKNIKEHIGFCLLLLLCVVLRLLPLFDYQYTYDELSGIDRTQFNSFAELIEKGVKVDAHPALVQVMLYVLVILFGYNTWIIKLPFILLSFVGIVYGYKFGLRNFSKQTGLLVTSFLCFGLFFVHHAPIARMYGAGVSFSLGLLFYFYEIIFQKDYRFSNYVKLVAFALLCAYNHHMNALFAASLFVIGFFLNENTCRKKFLVAAFICVVLYLPIISVTLYQLGLGGIGRDQGGWLDKPKADAFWNFITLIVGSSKMYVLVFAAILGAGVLNKEMGVTTKQRFLLVLFLLNFLIVFLYAIFKAPIYQHSVMIFAGTCLLIFILSFLQFQSTKVFLVVFSSLSAGLIVTTYINKDYFKQAVKTVFEYQFERTRFYKDKLGQGQVTAVFMDADDIMKKLYFQKYAVIPDVVSKDSSAFSMKHFSRMVSSLKSDYLILTSAMPAQQAVCKQYFPYLLENTQTQGINFKLYSKRKTEGPYVVPDDEIIFTSDAFQKNGLHYSKELEKTGGKLNIDSLTEFPFDIKGNYSELLKEEGNVLLSKASLKFSKVSEVDFELVTAINNKTTKQSYAYTARTASDFVCKPDSSVVVFTDYFAGDNHSTIKDKAGITVYLWNKKKSSAILTHIEIKVIRYWPEKWNYWK